MDKRTAQHHERVTANMERRGFRQSVELFNQLPLKLRRTLIITGMLLTALLITFGMLLPAHRFADEAALEYRQRQSLFAWMQANESRARVLNRPLQAQENVTKESLLSMLTSAAQNHDISIKRFEPRDGNELRVWLENVPFNNVILWLDRLQRLHGIDTGQITVTGQEQAGLVSAVIVLTVN